VIAAIILVHALLQTGALKSVSAWRWRSWRRSTALSSAAKDSEQENREIKAATGRLILPVRAMTHEKRSCATPAPRAWTLCSTRFFFSRCHKNLDGDRGA
jgi:hypothetical protein